VNKLRKTVTKTGGDTRNAGRASASSSDRRVLRVWVVDANAALGGLFAELLHQQPGIRCRRHFSSLENLLSTLAEERPPDVVLVDVYAGGRGALAALRPIRKLAPSARVLMMAMFCNSHYEQEAFRAGAGGFLLKSYETNEIVRLIHTAYRTPGVPELFPNLAPREAGRLDAAFRHEGGRFGVLHSLRQLYRLSGAGVAG
jgi:DNA-binding NarL/FixJ family response regulator